MRAGSRGARRPSTDKRRLILDAAVRVFARQGFHASRVADIADEAGVAYGLVYHYFASKDDVLDTVFLERWEVMLRFIRDTDRTQVSARQKLLAIASFIVDSYTRDPDLMKVMVVEVTRAANTFGQTHVAQIRSAWEEIDSIVCKAQADGSFRRDVPARFATLAFYGAIEQVLTGWIFGLLPHDEEHCELAKAMVVATVCSGLEVPATAVPARTRPRSSRSRVSGAAPGSAKRGGI